MDEDKKRQVVSKLHRLATLEVMITHGRGDLYDLIAKVCRQLDEDIVGPEGDTLLELSPEGDSWNVQFQDTEILKFELQRGSAPSTKHVVARCEVSRQWGEVVDTIAVFHLVKANDRGKWESVAADLTGATPVSEDTVLELLEDFVNNELKRYPE